MHADTRVSPVAQTPTRELFRSRAYLQLLSAQVVALVGTGLLTVALGLLAFDLAGADAGLVLGTALTIKMVAYVGVAPVMAALVHRLPRKAVLVGADVVRGGVACLLPFVTDTWQIYVLIFVLQTASATFTPTFQAILPEILPDERQYTRALSLSRLAYDLESLLSPALAAALLTLISYHSLFIGTVFGFVGSAVLVLLTQLPGRRPAATSPFLARLTRGTRLFLRTAELRGLLALNLVVAAGSALVIVNTVVFVQGVLARPQADVAVLLACYGGGSMVVALTLARLLDTVDDRRVMLLGGALVPLGLIIAAVGLGVSGLAGWITAISAWVVLGAATSMINTPSSRLVRRSADDDDRPAVFAAQFSLSHACFIITYPLAGVLGAAAGLTAASVALAGIAVLGLVLAVLAWKNIPHESGQANRQGRAS